MGFNRDYRPSLGIISALEVNLPIDKDGNFDLPLMRAWTEFHDEMERRKQEIQRFIVR
jgi:hypothetical protein